MDRFKRFRAYARAWATGEVQEGTHEDHIVAAAIGVRDGLDGHELKTIQELDVTIDSLGISVEDEPDGDAEDRDGRQLAYAQARLAKLIAAGGAVDPAGGSLCDAAADEIERLRREDIRLHGELAATEAYIQQAKEALEQARTKADELRGEAEAIRETLTIRDSMRDDVRRVLGCDPKRETTAQAAERAIRQAREAGAAEMRERAAALADEEGDRLRAGEGETPARDMERMAEEIRALQLSPEPQAHPLDKSTLIEGVDSAAAWRSTSPGGLSPEDVEALRRARWAHEAVWTSPDPSGIGWDASTDIGLRKLRAIAAELRALKVPAAAHGEPGKGAGPEATAAGKDSVAEERQGAQGEPRCFGCGAARGTAESPHVCPARPCEPVYSIGRPQPVGCMMHAPGSDACSLMRSLGKSAPHGLPKPARGEARQQARDVETEASPPLRPAEDIAREMVDTRADGTFWFGDLDEAIVLSHQASDMAKAIGYVRRILARLVEKIRAEAMRASGSPVHGPSKAAGFYATGAPTGMRVEKRPDGHEYLIETPRRPNDCKASINRVGVDIFCCHHVNGEHVGVHPPDANGVAEVIARWPIAPAQEERQQAIDTIDKWCSAHGFTLDKSSIREPLPNASPRERPTSWTETSGSDGDRVTGWHCGVEVSWPRDAQPDLVALDAAWLVSAPGARQPAYTQSLHSEAAGVRLACRKDADPRAVLATVAELLGLGDDPTHTETSVDSFAAGLAEGERRAKSKAAERATGWEAQAAEIRGHARRVAQSSLHPDITASASLAEADLLERCAADLRRLLDEARGPGDRERSCASTPAACRLYPVTPGPLQALAGRIEHAIVEAFSQPSDGERRGPGVAREVLRLVDEHLRGTVVSSPA